MVEAGDFAGVRVSQGEGSYEVRAKKVVFACGGFAQNEGMVGELAGGVAGECMPFCSAGSTGDAFALTESLGGVSVGKGAFTYWRDLFGLGRWGGVSAALCRFRGCSCVGAGERLHLSYTKGVSAKGAHHGIVR